MNEQAITSKLAFLTAVQFLTRIPVQGAMNGTMANYQAALKASVVFFPLVGVLIGLSTAASFNAFCFLWSPLIAAILSIGLEAWLTGAFHEDALADATDALGGGWTREQVLEILKDSRHGTYGVLALVIGVSLRIALVANCSSYLAWLAIPLSAGVGRWSILVVMNRLEPIQDRHTMARDVGTRPDVRTILVGLIAPLMTFVLCLLVCILLLPGELISDFARTSAIGGIASIFATLLTTRCYVGLIRRRVGGVTGDFLGSNCYLVQLSTLLAMQIGQFHR